MVATLCGDLGMPALLTPRSQPVNRLVLLSERFLNLRQRPSEPRQVLAGIPHGRVRRVRPARGLSLREEALEGGHECVRDGERLWRARFEACRGEHGARDEVFRDWRELVCGEQRGESDGLLQRLLVV